MKLYKFKFTGGKLLQDGYSKTIKVNVSSDEIPVQKIDLVSASNVSLKVKGTYQVKTSIEPADATNQTLTYTSANPNIATVDANGLITGVAEGTTNITATYSIGYNRTQIEKTVSVKVTDPSSKYSTGNLAATSSVAIMNNAPITVEAVANANYGNGIKLTFTGDGTASQYVLRFNLPADVKLKGDNQYATFEMTAKYNITGSYNYTNGQRYRLCNNATRVSTDQVQASSFNPVVSGNDDGFYLYSCNVSDFGISSGAGDDATFDNLELMIRPAAKAGDTMEFYGVEFGNISEYTLK